MHALAKRANLLLRLDVAKLGLAREIAVEEDDAAQSEAFFEVDEPVRQIRSLKTENERVADAGLHLGVSYPFRYLLG